MFVHRYGTGSRIFFGLHGWSGTHQTFAPFAQHLPNDVSLYAVDLPASGQSPGPAQWSLDWFEKALGEVMASLPAPGFTLVGNCSGALLGLLGASSVMPRIERFVLLDPFAYMPWYFRLFTDVPVLGQVAYYSSFANPLGRWLTNLSLAKHRQGETDLTGSFERVNHAAALRYLKLFNELGSIERFSSLNAPTDIFYGARTFAAVKSSVTMWQSLWPHADAKAVDAGHLPIVEATAQLSRLIFRHA